MKSGGIEKPKFKMESRGISQDRKDSLINKLKGFIPINRIDFRKSLAVSA